MFDFKAGCGTLCRLAKFRINGIPQAANYDITGICNARCQHCYFFKNWDLSQEITDNQWKNIFENHHLFGIGSATLTGGEPALRPEVIRHADNTFETVLIVSNGIIKIPEDINRRIFISIDGEKEIHESIRRIKKFDQIIENIKNDKRVILSPTLHMLNFDQINNIVKIAREQNVFGVTFSLYTADNINDPLLLKGKELDYTIEKLKEVLKNNKDIVFLTEKMIDIFKSKEHVKNCFLRSKWVISFYPDLRIKNPCVLGEKVDCQTCGCIVPIIMRAMDSFDFGSVNIVKKLFPSHAYSNSSLSNNLRNNPPYQNVKNK